MGPQISRFYGVFFFHCLFSLFYLPTNQTITVLILYIILNVTAVILYTIYFLLFLVLFYVDSYNSCCVLLLFVYHLPAVWWRQYVTNNDKEDDVRQVAGRTPGRLFLVVIAATILQASDN